MKKFLMSGSLFVILAMLAFVSFKNPQSTPTTTKTVTQTVPTVNISLSTSDIYSIQINDDHVWIVHHPALAEDGLTLVMTADSYSLTNPSKIVQTVCITGPAK